MCDRKNDDLVGITDSCRSTVTIQHNNVSFKFGGHFCVAQFWGWKQYFGDCFSVFMVSMLFVMKWLIE